MESGQNETSDQRFARYRGVPPQVVGWARFVLELACPIATVLLGLAAVAIALITGDISPTAMLGAGALGSGATAATRRGHSEACPG